MRTSTKFVGFALGLVVLFGIALGIGALVGSEPEESGEPENAGAPAPADSSTPGGLSNTVDGYRLAVENPIMQANPQAPLRFRILDRAGAPVTRYTANHDKDLHLIVVRRDLTAYQHVHPVLGGDGVWSTPLNLPQAGDYRVYADFVTADGAPYTLGADLRVAGDYIPKPLPPAAATATVDGYTVTLSGTLTPGASGDLTFTVSRDGKPVTDLQPYLGAYGHLVALRAADLGYLHVHPSGHPGDGVTAAGPAVTFAATAPSAGDYRLYLDFRHADKVRTAEFTVPVTTGPAGTGTTPTATSPAPTPAPGTDGHGHGH